MLTSPASSLGAGILRRGSFALGPFGARKEDACPVESLPTLGSALGAMEWQCFWVPGVSKTLVYQVLPLACGTRCQPHSKA